MSKIKTCKTHTALTAAEPSCDTQGLGCRAGERAGFLGPRVDSYGGEVPEVEFQSVGRTKATTSDTAYLWADLQSKLHLGRGQGCLQMNSGQGPWNEWEQSPGRHSISEWRVQAGAGLGRGPAFIVLRLLQGLRISKVYSNILQPFHQLTLPPWSSQLYFSGECARMTEARITDCDLFVILAFYSHRSCTFFWCKISCLGWPGVRPVPQMPLINLIERGSWGPDAQSDKSPRPGRHPTVIWCVLLASVLWATLIKESSLPGLMLLIWKLWWWLLMSKWYRVFFGVWEKKNLKGPRLTSSSLLASKMLWFFSLPVLPTSLFVVGKRNPVSAHCKHGPLHDSVVQ